MNMIENLRSRPVDINQWMADQVGFDNNGCYKSAYPKMAVVDNSEPMVAVSDFGIVSSDYYLGEYIKGQCYLEKAFTEGLLRPGAFLRESHVRRLQRVDQFLRRRGLFIHIQSGWRHPLLQEIIKDNYAQQFGHDKAARLFAAVLPDAAPPPHATGAAFDLELREIATGNRQELYYSHNGRAIYGHMEVESLVAVSGMESNREFQAALTNRRVLYHCLCTLNVVFDKVEELFTPHPGECWHYGDGDPLSAYLQQEPHARYGLANPVD